MGGHLVARRHAPGAPGIDREDQNLVAEVPGDVSDHLRSADRSGVDGDLVGARPEQRVDVGHRRHAATDGERNEDGLGRSSDDVERRLAALRRGGDVEESQLVSTLSVVSSSKLDRVTSVAQADEVDPLDYSPVMDIQARDDPDGNWHEQSLERGSLRLHRLAHG